MAAAEVELPPYASGPRYQVLEHLARYRFLTASQLLRLGVGDNIDQVYNYTRALRTATLIKRRQNNRLKGEPDIFWLTKAGADLVETDDGLPVEYPAKVNITGEIWHRMAIIDAHIELRLWADAQAWHVDWVKTDFVRSGKHGTKATTTPIPNAAPYVPDAVAQLTGTDGRARLLVIEVYWRGAAGLHHFRKKIDNVRAAATSHAVEIHNGFKPGDGEARYLVTFMDAETRRKACAALSEPTGTAWRQFFFADHPALLANFVSAWHDATGKPLSSLFDRVGSP